MRSEWPVRISEALRGDPGFSKKDWGFYVGLIGWSAADQESAEDVVHVDFKGKVPNASFPKAAIDWDNIARCDQLAVGTKFHWACRVVRGSITASLLSEETVEKTHRLQSRCA